MARYLVLVPAREASVEARLKGAVFVREGFSLKAFVLGPVWFAWHGHFLVALAVLVALIALALGITALGLGDNLRSVIGMLVMGLLGLEAANLRVLDLEWRGFTLVDLKVGTDLSALERQFFEEALRAAAASEQAAPQPPGVGTAAFPVLGLFPRQGGLE